MQGDLIFIINRVVFVVTGALIVRIFADFPLMHFRSNRKCVNCAYDVDSDIISSGAVEVAGVEILLIEAFTPEIWGHPSAISSGFRRCIDAFRRMKKTLFE